MSIALVFPGQGAQYVGMGKDLAAQVPAARLLLETADRVLGFPLSKVIAEGPADELTRTDVSQPAILVASLMSLEALKAKHAPQFTAAAGLSLGEYTALVATGALDFEAAVRLVRLRGEAMQAAAEAVKSGMVALIGADEASAQRLCDACATGPDGKSEVLQVANLNSPGQVVISGAAAACARAAEQVQAKGKELGIRKAIPLPVAGAFHSALMAPAAERLRAALAKTVFRDPRVPVYANVHASAVSKASDIPELLIAQLTKPVRWADSVVNMHKAGIGEFWEFGPGKTISGMIQRTVTGAVTKNLDGAAEAAAF
jgi:[acyl-carrier-protein] S-malonyltransferase